MNASEERAQLVVTRAREWREDGIVDAAAAQEIAARFAQPWRTHGLIVQLVFFFLTFLAQGAFYGFLKLVGFPKTGLFAAAAFLVLAELLIGRFRWFATGVEAALWLGAMISIVTELPRTGSPEAALVVAAAVGIASWRVRNPLFGVLAVCTTLLWFEQRFDAGTVAAVVIGFVALGALLREWQRPSAELFWAVLAIAAPVAGRFAADTRWVPLTIALYAAFGTFALALALLRRHHALFLAAGLGLGIAAVDLGRRIDAPAEALLGAGGLFLLALSWAVSQALRGRTTGLVVTPAKLTRMDDALEVAGALAAAHATAPEPPSTDGRPAGGGSFGGAGATGEF